MKSEVWSGLAAVLTLAGCSVGEPYLRPETPVPAAWTTAADNQGPESRTLWPTADWWRQFGVPALDALMAEAEKNNVDLAAAATRVRQADAQARVAGAPLLPSLDASGNANRQLQPSLQTTNTSSKSGTSAAVEPKTVFSTSLSASYELDFWGKNREAEASAEAAAEASRFDHQTVALTLQSGVASSYFNVIGVQDRLAVARANLTNAETVQAAIADRLHYGTATDLDLAQQESVVAGLRAGVPPLEQQLRQNTTALAVLLGRLPETISSNRGTLAQVRIPVVTPGLPAELLARRPDVRFAEAQLRAAHADANAARAALFPSLKLTAETGFESLALGTLLHGSSLLYSMAAGVTQPIFHGDALRGGMELKQARADELVLNYRKAVIAAFADTENALIAVRKGAEENAAQQRAVATAQRANDIAQAQFKAGLIDITTLLNTQKTLFQAQDALVQSRLGHLQAVISLFKALGGGWRASENAKS